MINYEDKVSELIEREMKGRKCEEIKETLEFLFNEMRVELFNFWRANKACDNNELRTFLSVIDMLENKLNMYINDGLAAKKILKEEVTYEQG